VLSTLAITDDRVGSDGAEDDCTNDDADERTNTAAPRQKRTTRLDLLRLERRHSIEHRAFSRPAIVAGRSFDDAPSAH
jgi:hypothetical protein